MWLYFAGTFDRFWFWTFKYGSHYATSSTWDEGISALKDYALALGDSFILLWLIAPLGLIILWIGKCSTQSKLFIFSFAVFSFFSITPGLYFRQHYFVLLLPAIALLDGIFIDYLRTFISEKLQLPKFSWVALSLFILACITGIIKLYSYLFTDNMLSLSRTMYGSNPFPESVSIARFIKSNTEPQDRIAVLGSEPQICFYSDRLSGTGYIYTYSLMEDQPFSLQMQDEMISEIEHSQPKILVFCNVPTSWLVKTSSSEKIFHWVQDYTAKDYDLKGVVVIPNSRGAALYYWNSEVKNYQLSSENKIMVFLRRN